MALTTGVTFPTKAGSTAHTNLVAKVESGRLAAPLSHLADNSIHSTIGYRTSPVCLLATLIFEWQISQWDTLIRTS